MPVSVIIPVYERKKRLCRAIDSVLNQPEVDELIVVDDGSNRDIESAVAHYGKKLRYVRQLHSGVSAARNRGIAESKYEWLAFLDSDDEWLAGKLALQLDGLKSSQRKISHTEEIWIRNGIHVNPMNKHRKRGGNIFIDCLPLCAVSPSSVLMHRDIFDDVSLFDEDLPACEDYDLWLRIALTYEFDFVEQACLNKYGGHDDQLSRKYWGMDRFRVRSLHNLLKTRSMTQTQTQTDAVRAMLLKKLEILRLGATKRNNIELLEWIDRTQAEASLATDC